VGISFNPHTPVRWTSASPFADAHAARAISAYGSKINRLPKDDVDSPPKKK
jgi:hypothetical protein